MLEQIVRGPLLIPKEDGSVTYYPDGLLVADPAGIVEYAGENNRPRPGFFSERGSDGVMMPPLLDIHTHIPQHPIRGRFLGGVSDDVAEGRLIAGLNRNVFPAEAKCSEPEYAERVVRAFLADTLAHGVVGGAAYLTVSARATEIALSILPESWSVGLVLMNQNCPENLRTDEAALDDDVRRLAKKFGRRLIVTDRFAVAVDTPLRRRAAAFAKEFGLRTQTHLNEQVPEKEFVEKRLYPNHASYAEVYRADGLLDHDCIVAHCVHMTDDEWNILRDSGSVIAHCPTSNLLLGSGVMRLDTVLARKIPYAIATDVGASPTVSMLAEMKRFMQVHEGRSAAATGSEALYRATLAPAELLGIASQFGRLRPGAPMSFIEVESRGTTAESSADAVIESLLPDDLNDPAPSVRRVTVRGKTVFQRGGNDA